MMASLRTYALLFVVFFFATASNGFAHESESSDDTDIAMELVPTFDVNATLINFEKDQEEKILAASALIKKIIVSNEFKQRVLNYEYNGKKQFVDNDGLSNRQIYNKIMRGSEYMLNLGNNKTMDLELELYTDLESNTIGYTYPSVVRVWMNRKYFDKFQPFQVADNMVHEWLHKIGFKHEVEVTPSRRHSVPYAIGYIVKAMAKRHSR